MYHLKGARSKFAYFEKLSKFFKFWRLESVSVFAILNHPLWFIIVIISAMFFYLSKLLCSGFLPFLGDFVRGQKRQNTVNEFV